jgi:hypothetical protein
MSQVVEAHVRQADAYQKPPENFPQGAGAKVVALSVGKHQIFLNPGASTLRLRNIHNKIGGKSEGEEFIHAEASDNNRAERERARGITLDQQTSTKRASSGARARIVLAAAQGVSTQIKIGSPPLW